MRTFIAIELDKQNKDALSKIQEELKTTGADVKWVKPSDIHLTLKFLGEINEQKIDKISACLKTAASKTKPFPIILSGIGIFPSQKLPRVVWLGITEGKEALERLTYNIEDLLAGLKFPKEKRGFSPHFTLGRVKSRKNKEALLAKLGHTETDELRQEIKSVVLFKSTLTPAGPIYEVVGKFILTGGFTATFRHIAQISAGQY